MQDTFYSSYSNGQKLKPEKISCHAIHSVTPTFLFLQESAEKEEIERLKQLLLNYEEKEKEGLEAVKKQAASQAELAKETSKLKQQLETERTEFGKQIDSLIRERDMYKVKAEEFQTQPTEEGKVGVK